MKREKESLKGESGSEGREKWGMFYCGKERKV